MRGERRGEKRKVRGERSEERREAKCEASRESREARGEWARRLEPFYTHSIPSSGVVKLPLSGVGLPSVPKRWHVGRLDRVALSL